MKRLIGIFWIIIIIGIAAIAIKFTNPKSSDDELPIKTSEITKTEETLPVEKTATPPEDVPKNYVEYISNGKVDLASNKITSAISNFSAAVELNPNSIEPLIYLGQAYLENNEPDKAELTFRKADKIESGLLQINFLIAQSLLDQRKIEDAKNLIWSLDPNNYETKYYTALILILYKDFEGAKTKFKEIANSVEPTVNQSLKDNSRKFLDAYDTFSYYKEGENVFLETLLAKVFTEVGQYEAAIPLLYDVINQKNNYRDAWIILGYAYLNRGKIPDAIDALTQAKDLDPDKPQTLFFLGIAHFFNNDIDKSIIYLEQANSKGFEPKDQLNTTLGELYLMKQNYEKSAASYEKVLSVNTTNINIFVRAIWLNIDKLNKADKALSLAYKALSVYPNEAMSYNLVGWALIAGKDYTNAERYLEKALELNPDFDVALLNLGWLYESENSITLAKEYYKKAYMIGKGNSISTLAAKRFNNLKEKENLKNSYKVNTFFSY